jgi:hypothetical protein
LYLHIHVDATPVGGQGGSAKTPICSSTECCSDRHPSSSPVAIEGNCNQNGSPTPQGGGTVIPTLGPAGVASLQHPGHNRALQQSCPDILAQIALTEVLRSRTLQPKEKCRWFHSYCAQPAGWLIKYCMEGNGWSSQRNRMEGVPQWAELVHRLEIARAAYLNNEPLPEFEEEVSLCLYCTALFKKKKKKERERSDP